MTKLRKSIGLLAGAVLLIAIGACGTSGDAHNADRAAKPPGEGWFCLEGSGQQPSRCARTQAACEVEAGFATELAAEAGESIEPRCVAVAQATCLTHGAAGSDVQFECFRERSHCSNRRFELAGSRPSFCDPWS